MDLRPYQTTLIEQARALMLRRVRSMIITSPTGSGKTVLTAHMLKSAQERGMVAWFLVHRRELVKQTIEALNEVGVKHGVCAAGWAQDKNALIQVASIQTMARRFQYYRKPALMVFDEAQHCAASTWSKLYSIFPEAYKVGLTATPQRLDGKGLRKYFGELIRGPSVALLIEQGFLSQFKIYAPSQISVEGLRTRMGDFAKEELAIAADKPTITGCAVDHYLRLSPGKRAVVFCAGIAHSEHVVAQFQSRGIAAEHVDGKTDPWKRDLAIKRFKNGEIKVLSNVELFGEGFDVPAIESVILLRPTQSLALHLQQIGRALRPVDGKSHAIVLDHAGNTLRHGLPDEDRQWSLDGNKGSRKSTDAARVACRICPSCFAAQGFGTDACRYCGGPFQATPREVEQVEGTLEEIDARAIQLKRKSEQANAHTLEELVEIGKSRGYRAADRWARYIWDARQAKQSRGNP